MFIGFMGGVPLGGRFNKKNTGRKTFAGIFFGEVQHISRGVFFPWIVEIFFPGSWISDFFHLHSPQGRRFFPIFFHWGGIFPPETKRRKNQSPMDTIDDSIASIASLDLSRYFR